MTDLPPSVLSYSEDDERARVREAQHEVAHANLNTATLCLIILTCIAVFATLYFASDIVLPLVMAGVLNLLLQPARRFLTDRIRIPASLTAVLLILVLLGTLAGIATAISVPASAWIGKAPQGLHLLQEKLQFLTKPIAFLEQGLQRIEAVTRQTPAEGVQTVALQQSTNMGGVGVVILEGTRAILAPLLTVVVVLFFMLASGDMLLRRLVEIVPTWGDKRRVVAIASEVERNVSGYLATITVMNLLVGVANGLSMWLQGMPDPLLWGTLAFLLNYIPIIGPALGVVIFFFVALFSAPTVGLAFGPPGLYLLIHLIEGQTVTPMLLARQFTLNPVLVIVSLFFWDWLWGIPGALLSVPLLAILKIVCDRIPNLMPLGHLLGTTMKPRNSDAAAT